MDHLIAYSFQHITLMLCFLGHSHDNNCIAIAMSQRVIKQVGLRVITHPYISTGQLEFHLKSFDQTTPSSVLKSVHVCTHGTQYRTSYCTNWCIYVNNIKWYIHTQKQHITWILLWQKHSSMNSYKNTSKLDFKKWKQLNRYTYAVHF